MNRFWLYAAFITTMLLLSACATPTQTATPAPSPTPGQAGSVSWEDAKALILRGEVRQVMQLHSLKVTLYLRNGQQLDTVEPQIDEVIKVVRQCGARCADVMIATE